MRTCMIYEANTKGLPDQSFAARPTARLSRVFRLLPHAQPLFACPVHAHGIAQHPHKRWSPGRLLSDRLPTGRCAR